MGLFGAVALVLMLLIGVDVWLWYAAFGAARCTGIDVFAAISFTIINLALFLGIYTLAFQGIDILSDMVASRGVRKSKQEDELFDIRVDRAKADNDAAKARAEAAALRAVIQGQKAQNLMNPSNVGGMVIDTAIMPKFDDLEE